MSRFLRGDIMSKNDLVVKTNRLNIAIQNLSLSEIRIIQLAIIDSRETGNGLKADKPLVISASRYAKAFGVKRQTASEAILDAEKNLFERRFSFLDNDNKVVKTRWIQRVKYLDDEASIEVIFTYDVVNEITRINGIEQFFTSYLLEQTADMKSAYSVRLYELLVQWKAAKTTPVFELKNFREQLGLDAEDYQRMDNFKKRVLDLAVDEINEKSDLIVTCDQEKRGRSIVGFKFKVLTKPKVKQIEKEVGKRDENTSDMFTIDGLNDKQLGRIARNPRFMADYNHLVSATSAAGGDTRIWEIEMINRLKKDASVFKKRPIRDYLEY